MSNGYEARKYPRDTGIWSSPPFRVHGFALLHCSANQTSPGCCHSELELRVSNPPTSHGLF